ncbi:hypothetical protein M8C17_17275 [Micromonospora sp. RHAY321]|uniref:DUF7660 family protein n=1 Tax=Micromonospora sp. RHAY321 TaxID=2944807 RepID=UPI00207C15C4|nr:hypothetical protein [Micromonospora sp. RHAY321]MCO1596908.1 hypothetical protein [Micromonospora sp. RHAY321]
MEHDLDALAAGVADHVDFAHFAYALAADVADHPENWENRNLETFLEAWGDFSRSIESWARNNGEEVPITLSWRLLAEMLLVAREYE